MTNAAHIHLVLNHFPIVGLTFSLLFLILGLFRSHEFSLKTSLLLIITTAAISVPTYLTGEPAEKIIEKMPSFAEAILEEHEEAAEFAIIAVGITTMAAVACFLLFIKNKLKPKTLVRILLVFNLFALMIVARTNYLGGKISHPEVREAANPTSIQH